MVQSFRKLFGGLFVSTKSSSVSKRAPLNLEALGERLVPSTIPNLVGDTFSFGSGRSLQITQQSLGNGYGSFTGSFHDSGLADGFVSVSVNVTGTITPVSTNSYNITYHGSSTTLVNPYYNWMVGESVSGGGVYTTSTTVPNHYQGYDLDSWALNGAATVNYNIDSATPSVSFDGSGSVGHAASN